MASLDLLSSDPKLPPIHRLRPCGAKGLCFTESQKVLSIARAIARIEWEEFEKMIYEYRCQDCETQFEVWAKISDPAPESCPDCSSSNLEKVISATSFALKGGGWYSQGYASSTGGSKTNNDTKPKNDSKIKESKIQGGN